MTTARKVVLIVATALLVGGAAIAFGAFAAAGFDFRNLSNSGRDWESAAVTLPAETDAPHTAIVMRGGDASVRFEPADGDAVEVKYWNNSERQVNVVDEGGTVSIEEENWNRFRVMFFYFGDFQDHTTVVKVPRSFTGTIEVQVDNSSIDVSQIEGLESATIVSQNGNIKVAGVEVGALKLRTQNGMVEASDATAKELLVEAQNGTATLADIDADALKVTSTNGEVRLSRVSAQSVSATSMNALVEAAMLAADDIELTTMNGEIQAIMEGSSDDYAIDAASVNGTVDVPRGADAADATKHLTACSENGAISVTFAESDGNGAGEDAEDSSGGSGTREGLAAPATPTAPAAPEAPKAPAAS